MGHALTIDSASVAEGREIRRLLPLPADILVENLVHNSADGLINRPALNIILVIGSAVGNVIVITPAFIPFRVDPIQCKSDDGIDIGRQSSGRPCRVDLAAGYVFHIVRKGDLHVGSVGAGGP